MEYARRNILTISLILFAIAAFASELAGSLPEGVGATTSQVAVVSIAAARGLVLAAEALAVNKETRDE
jgi:hypothetical protein